MSAMPYTDLEKGGIRSPKDLLKLDWDSINDNVISEEEQNELERMLEEEKRRIDEKRTDTIN